MSTKNTNEETKQVQYECPKDIHALFVRFQTAKQTLEGGRIKTLPKITVHFLNGLKSKIEMQVIKIETEAKKQSK